MLVVYSSIANLHPLFYTIFGGFKPMENFWKTTMPGKVKAQFFLSAYFSMILPSLAALAYMPNGEDDLNLKLWCLVNSVKAAFDCFQLWWYKVAVIK